MRCAPHDHFPCRAVSGGLGATDDTDCLLLAEETGPAGKRELTVAQMLIACRGHDQVKTLSGLPSGRAGAASVSDTVCCGSPRPDKGRRLLRVSHAMKLGVLAAAASLTLGACSSSGGGGGDKS